MAVQSCGLPAADNPRIVPPKYSTLLKSQTSIETDAVSYMILGRGERTSSRSVGLQKQAVKSAQLADGCLVATQLGQSDVGAYFGSASGYVL